MNKIFFKYAILLLSVFLSTLIISCKNASSPIGPDEVMAETKLLKISIQDTEISKADVSVKVEGRVFLNGELIKGVQVPINKLLTITATTLIPDAAIFWSGRKIVNEDRREKEISITIDNDTYIVLVVGEDNNPIETKKLSINVSDNGKLVVNDEIYDKGYNIITLAKSQDISLLAIPDVNYYFAGWYGDLDFDYEKSKSIIMDKDKYVLASFVDDVSVRLTVSPIKNGNVKINGDIYDVNKEYRYKIGDYVKLEAIADSGSKFLGWSGAISSSEAIYEFQVDKEMQITPVFGKPNGVVVLTINPSGSANKVKYKIKRGNATTPEKELNEQYNIIYYDGIRAPLENGDIIEFTAVPSSGYTSDVNWSYNGTTETGLTKTYTMTDESISISANFTLKAIKLTVEVVREYIDTAGNIVAEVNNSSDALYVPKLENSPKDNWGFDIKIGNYHEITFYNSGAFIANFNNTSPPEPKYNDNVSITAISGNYYTFEKMLIGTDNKPSSTENFIITKDTTIKIYLRRKQIPVILNISGGNSANLETGSGFYTSKVKVSGSVLSDGEYPASTSVNTFNTLAGSTITFSPTLSDVHDIDLMPASIVDIKTTQNVSASFTNKLFTITGKIAKRLDNNALEAEQFNVNGGFAVLIGDSTVDVNNQNKTTFSKNYPYGEDLQIGGVGGLHYKLNKIINDLVATEGLSKTIKVKKDNNFTVDIEHIRRDINVQIIGGKFATSISKLKIEREADDTSPHVTSHDATGDNNIASPIITIKVLSGRNIKITAEPSSMHKFGGYTGDINSLEKVAFTSVSSNMSIHATFQAVWGAGTLPTLTNNTYQITSANELAWVADQSQNYGNTFANMTIKLKANIDMSNILFEGIATKPGTSFKGTFDGDKKEIKNIYINNSSMPAAFIGTIEGGAVVKKLGISGKIIASGNQNASGIVSVMNKDSKVEDCYNTAEIIAESGNASGIVHSINSSATGGGKNTLRRVYNAGKVYSTNATASGILNYFGGGDSDSEFEDVYNIGLITGNNSRGIVDFTDGGNLRNAYNVGALVSTSTNPPAGIIGSYNNVSSAPYKTYYLKDDSINSSAISVAPDDRVKAMKKIDFTINSLLTFGFDKDTWEIGTSLNAGLGIGIADTIAIRPILKNVGPSSTGNLR